MKIASTRILSLLVFTFIWSSVFSQNNSSDRRVIQFSGAVVEAEGNAPIPFVNIVIRGLAKGTTTDYFGFFSLVVREGDTIQFSAVGYKPSVTFIPRNIPDEEDGYYTLKKLIKDTVNLKAKTIKPYPSKEQFADAFLNLKVDEDDYERAIKNLNQQELNQIKAGTPMDGSLNYKAMMQQQYYSMYYAGQLPPANILNPIAWVKFFDALKKGKLKNPNK
mgnify:CR=1 FL=1